jgi:putative ABC transport system permease protein
VAATTLSGLSPDLAEELRATPGVDVVTQSRMTPAIVGGEATDPLFGFDASTMAGVVALGTVDGDLSGLGTNGIAVSADHAAHRGWAIGSTVPVTFPSGNTDLVVEVVYSDATEWVGDVFVGIDALRANGVGELDHQVFVSGDENAIERVAGRYASADVLDEDEFVAEISAEIDTMLGMFYALLMLAVVIALLGIANTLALSIFERTRELGVLRAVGMRRSQVRSSVRWESIIIALFGTTLGLALGTFFGWGVVRAMADDGIDTLDVPVSALAVLTAVAAVAGAMAAVVPARRAARLDVLTAVAAR